MKSKMLLPTLEKLPPAPPGKTGWPWSVDYAEISNSFKHCEAWPKLTVVTPSYQQGRFIEETIRSVLSQGYPNLEYFIIDGGSTDETVEIIQKYAPYIDYWVSEPDRGQGHAVNKGWSMATGHILGWLNSDDLYLPGTLKKVAESFMQDKALELVTGFVSGTDIDLVEYRRKPPRDFDLEYYLWFATNLGPGQPGIFLASDLYRQVGPIDETLYYTLDREYWMRIAQMRPDLRYLKLSDDLAIAREYQGNKSSDMSIKLLCERIKLLDKVYSRPNLNPSVERLKGPAYSAAHYNLANKLFDRKQFSEASEHYAKAIQYRPPVLFKEPKIISSFLRSWSLQGNKK